MVRFQIFCLLVLLTACSSSPNATPSLAASAAGSSSGAGGQVAQPTPYPGIPRDPNVICASLGGEYGEGNICPSPEIGLLGNIYVLENGYSGPEIHISDIITNGAKLTQKIQMTNFNVPTRDFTEGFPLSDGTLLKGPNGQPITAWFAFDIRGYLTLRAPWASGQYQFAFFVDDGAILSVDGREILNFDGYHSPQWSCQTTPIQLSVDEVHPLALKYFQGPPTQLALRMLFRPYDANKPCDDSGGFVPLPMNFLSN